MPSTYCYMCGTVMQTYSARDWPEDSEDICDECYEQEQGAMPEEE